MLARTIRKYWSLRRQTFNPRYWLSHAVTPVCDNDRRLLELRDKHRGQRCFVLGNGPSLNAVDLTRLANEVTFGTNAIYLNYERMGFHPTYYAVEDVLVAEDRAVEINAYRESLKFFPNYLRRWIHTDEKTLWFNFVDPRGIEFPGFSRDASLCVYFGGTVSYVCLQLAFTMGFTTVYLVGFDHHYVIRPSVMRDGNRLTSTADDPNHFSPAYFGKGKRWHEPRVDRMEMAYRKANVEFDRAGRKIYNATAGGKLEVFERVAFDSIFA